MELYFPHETIARLKPNSIAEEDSFLNQNRREEEDEVDIIGLTIWDRVLKDGAILGNARTLSGDRSGEIY